MAFVFFGLQASLFKMFQTKEEVEAELIAFKVANPNGMTRADDKAVVTSFNSMSQYQRSYIFHMA